MASSVFEKSSLRLGSIQQHMSGFQTGLNQAASTIVNINKTLFKQKVDNQKLIRKDRFRFNKQQSLERAKLAEEQVEAKNINTALNNKKPEDAIKDNPKKGFLGRMLDFIGLLVGGWLLLNWKTIFNLGKGFLERINGIIKIFRGFVTGVADFFRGLPSAIAGAAAGLFSVTDFQPESQAMNKGLINLQENMVNMRDQMNLVSGEYQKAANDLSTEENEEMFNSSFIQDPFTAADDNLNLDDETTSTDNSLNPLLELIGSAEAAQHGYNSVAPNDHNPDLTTMTIAEAAKAIGVNGGKGAIGRYQFTKPIEQAKLAGLGPDDIFSAENQDKMALALIKKRGVTMEMIKNNPTKAGNLLAKEWASLPLLSDLNDKKRGESFYHGEGNNQATIPVEKLEEVLKIISKEVKGDVREGYSNQGWDFLNWIPDDVLNKKDADLSSLKVEKGPNVVFVPTKSKDQNVASSNTTKRSSGDISFIIGGSGLNRDDILINELAYT